MELKDYINQNTFREPKEDTRSEEVVEEVEVQEDPEEE